MIGVNSSTAIRSLSDHLRILLYPVSVVKRLHCSTSGFFAEISIPVASLRHLPPSGPSKLLINQTSSENGREIPVRRDGADEWMRHD